MKCVINALPYVRFIIVFSSLWTPITIFPIISDGGARLASYLPKFGNMSLIQVTRVCNRLRFIEVFAKNLLRNISCDGFIYF